MSLIKNCFVELVMHWIPSAFKFKIQAPFGFHPPSTHHVRIWSSFDKIVSQHETAILCLFTDWTCASSSGVFLSRHQPSHTYLSSTSTFTPLRVYSISSIRMYADICGGSASFKNRKQNTLDSQPVVYIFHTTGADFSPRKYKNGTATDISHPELCMSVDFK